VGIGLLMLALVIIGGVLRARARLYEARWFLVACELAAPLGFLAVIAGWVTTEVGRQPWTVYGLMRTAASSSPSLSGGDVLASLIGYGLGYLVMFTAGIAMMARIVKRGPAESTMEPEPVESGRPGRPVRALPREPEVEP